METKMKAMSNLLESMATWSSTGIALVVLGLGVLPVPQSFAADAGKEDYVTTQSMTVEHIRISANRSFDEVKAALESRLRTYEPARLAPFLQKGDMAGARAELERLVSPTGLSILYSLNHGRMLSLEGGARKAVGYGIGNILTATSMTRHNLAAGLYAPIRVVLYEGVNGSAVFEYDKPSSTFGLFRNAEIDTVATQLDIVLKDVLKSVSH